MILGARALKIAMISLYLPSDTKMGVGYQAHAMANGFVARGHSVVMFSACAKPEGARYDYHRVEVGDSLRTFRFAWNLRKTDFSGFDVVHAHGDNYWLWSRRHRPPVIRTMHGSCLAEAWKVPGIKEKLRMLLLYGAEVLATLVSDKTVCVSENTLKYYPWLETVIPNGVDVAAYAAPAGTAEKLGVRSWKLEDDDEGGFTTKTQRHEGRGDEVTGDRLQVTEGRKDPQISQIPQIPQITGLASQPAGRGPAGDEKLGVRSEKLVDGASRQVYPAGPTESAALPQPSNSYLLTSNSSSADSNSYLLTPNSCGKSATPTVLFVGTYGNRKRGKLLMDVFAREVLPKLPEAQLWMVCSDAPAAAGVCVLGRLSQAELVARYQRAWVFCLPSTYEGFGIPYIEAMAAGTAVVASPNVGAVEVTREGQDGLIATDDKLGEALVQVLTDEVLRHKLEAAGRKRVKEFDLNSVCERYEEIYAAAATSQ